MVFWTKQWGILELLYWTQVWWPFAAVLAAVVVEGVDGWPRFWKGLCIIKIKRENFGGRRDSSKIRRLKNEWREIKRVFVLILRKSIPCSWGVTKTDMSWSLSVKSCILVRITRGWYIWSRVCLVGKCVQIGWHTRGTTITTILTVLFTILSHSRGGAKIKIIASPTLVRGLWTIMYKIWCSYVHLVFSMVDSLMRV